MGFRPFLKIVCIYHVWCIDYIIFPLLRIPAFSEYLVLVGNHTAEKVFLVK